MNIAAACLAPEWQQSGLNFIVNVRECEREVGYGNKILTVFAHHFQKTF